MQIRTAIRIVEGRAAVRSLTEMPLLHHDSEDFGLKDAAMNRDEYERLIRSPYHEVEDNGVMLLGNYEHDGVGEFFLVNQETKKLLYYVEYQVERLPRLGDTAYQVVLWRSFAAGYPGITRKVFNIILQRFGSIMCDTTQTHDGQRFWVDRMAEAFNAGLTVGMMDHRGDLNLYDGSMTFQQWFTDQDGWGDTDDHMENRFFITKKAL